jgi:hypothetical protein
MPIVPKDCGPLVIPEVAAIVQPEASASAETPMRDCPPPAEFQPRGESLSKRAVAMIARAAVGDVEIVNTRVFKITGAISGGKYPAVRQVYDPELETWSDGPITRVILL